MLGIREVLRGGAVVFTSGYKAQNLESGKIRQTFLEMTKSVSETIGAIFFDTTDFLLGADDTYYSDGVHLNSKGNARVAARMTAFFLGENIIKPVIAKCGGYLGCNYDYFNVYGGQYNTNGASASNGLEVSNKTAELRSLKTGETFYFPFYLEDSECEIKLLCGDTWGMLELSCDFKTEQYIQRSDLIAAKFREEKASEVNNFFAPISNFKIYGKGFHVLKIQNNSGDMFYLNQILIKEIEKNKMNIELGDLEITGPNLANFFNNNYSKIKPFLNYNDGKIHGNILSSYGNGHNWYYETYKYGSGHLNGSLEKPTVFVIKVYCSDFSSQEKMFVFKVTNANTAPLGFYYEAAAFEKPKQ